MGDPLFPTYPKINSVFKRHPKNGHFILDTWAQPEYGLLAEADWQWFAKVNGCNVRIGLQMVGAEWEVRFGGRSDRATMPPKLLDHLMSTFHTPEMKKRYSGSLDVSNGSVIVLYGEGYGGSIQHGGNYRPDEAFILFDVLEIFPSGRKLWWHKHEVSILGEQLEIPVVPCYGRATLTQAIGIVSAHELEPMLGEPKPEGLVGAPSVPLYTEFGERIICKIKGDDFK